MASEEIESRDAGQDDQSPQCRILEVGGEGTEKQESGRHDEKRWDRRIAPRLVGPLFRWLAHPKDKNCSRGQHVKKPFGK